MRTPLRGCLLSAALALASAAAAQAHLSYVGHDYGTFSGGIQAKTITGQSAETLSGWADGTDADFALTHYQVYFKFTLQQTTTITLSVTSANPAKFLPALSIFLGLGHTAPPDYDEDNFYTMNYVNSLPGGPKEGAFRALNNWRMANDDGAFSNFTYMGNVADGTATNYGTAAGINGDGVADGFVRGTFTLGPGSYTVVIGGANYFDQDDAAYYAFDTTAMVVPEPSSALLLAGGLSVVGLRRRRSKSFNDQGALKSTRHPAAGWIRPRVASIPCPL